MLEFLQKLIRKPTNYWYESRDAEFILKSEQEVFWRIMCLWTIVERSDLEIGLNVDKTYTLAQATEFNQFSINRIEKLELNKYLSPREKAAVAKKLGEWNKNDQIDLSWRNQALAVLLWAVNLLPELKSYDDGYSINETLTTLQQHKFHELVKLRNRATIVRQRDIAELWHWRARQERLLKENFKVDKQKVIKANKQMANYAYKANQIPKVIKNDFGVLGKAYHDLNPNEFQRLLSLAMERHFAFNWLCGVGESWDSTPTDT